MFLDIETIQKPENDLCGCTKFGFGEGWSRDGDDQMYSGLNSVSGSGIFNGDICKIDGGADPVVCEVIFEDGCFCIRWNANDSRPELKYYIDMDFCSIEIIGSTHLTPELVP